MPWFLPSFLTPTFLVLGVLAISLPVLFHFFRRTPKGNVQFSTLMFLQPSPPRLTRRSRVDNWLLLILRALVLLFIALAFGRIFFRQTDFLNLSDLPSRRIAVLVDTSASMFRGDLWDQAKNELSEVLEGMGPNDEVGLFAFDSELRTIVGFSSEQLENDLAKTDLLKSSLDSLAPRWQTTNLGQVLIDTIDIIQRDRESDSGDQISESQVILISDMQSGSNIDALRSFEWPKTIPLEIKKIGEPVSDNATLSLASQSNGIADSNRIRVKVSNVRESRLSQFDLHWMHNEPGEETLAATVVVPPGQSRIVNLKVPDFDFDGIELKGDNDEFDNRFFMAYPKRIPQEILFVGGNDDLRNQLRFYLKKACSSLIGKRFEFSDRNEIGDMDADNAPPGFVFVTGSIDKIEAEKIREYNKNGGRVCVVITSVDMQDTIANLLEKKVTLSVPEKVDFALLSKIDFSHKLFVPFADPKYSNFSNIRFWKYRDAKIDGLNAIAEFDTGAVAIGNQKVGDGQFFLISSGWHPADSQLALSTKFVGIMMGMMLKKLTQENRNLEIGSPVRIAEFVTEEECSLVKPDGNQVELSNLSSSKVIPEVDLPGIYQLASNRQSKRVAFNLPASESRTDPLSKELLEQEDVKLGTMSTATEKVEKERQRKDKELENRQKLWRWMLILALCTLFAETVLSSFLAKRQSQADVATQES